MLGCGATSTTVSPEAVPPAAPCTAPIGDGGYEHVGLTELEDADAWWAEVTAEAASLFHTDGTPAELRREFFETHVYTERPSLVVELDAFALTDALALTLVAYAIRLDDHGSALAWIARARPSAALENCAEAIRAADP